MRLFVAIDIEPQVQKRIEAIQQTLKRDLNLSGREVKWVRPDQIHLTLKFLGEVDDQAVMSVCDIVTRTAGRFEGFEFEVKGAGVFGRPARVVWAGVSPCKVLGQLQSALEKEFEALGWPRESRAFAGHLTMCRVKNTGAGRKLADAMAAWRDESFGTVGADSVVVYQSQLGREGAEYSVVCTAPLK